MWALLLLLLFYLFIYCRLEDDCFTALCGFLPFVNMDQPQVSVCPLPPHPILLGYRRARGLSSLSHTVNFHWLSILHMVMRKSIPRQVDKKSGGP